MSTPLHSSIGQANAGLGQTPAETGFGANRDPNGNDRREDAGEMAQAAAFAMQLAGARASAAVDMGGDDTDVVVVASPPPLPVSPVMGSIGASAADASGRAATVAALTEVLRTEIDAADRIRLGGAPLTLNIPLNSAALGLAEARLTLVRGEVSIVFPVPAGTDMVMVNGALAELAQTLAQRFPNRTIRLRGEEAADDRLAPAEFNPLKEPVGRRK